MIKAIFFDMDGVLVDADRLHFAAFNDALVAVDAPPILWSEHESIYKGLPTKQKLELLVERTDFPKSSMSEAARIKQDRTIRMIRQVITPDAEKIAMLRSLGKDFKICVCSNAKRETVEEMLKAAGLIEYCHAYFGNQDVQAPKPAPDIYLRAMQQMGVTPDTSLIVEDSDVGRQAARATGAHVVCVDNPSEANFYRISSTIRRIHTPHVVIPAAGQGKRFLEAGYNYPKPLIEVGDAPMIELVLRNFREVGDPIVILQRKHCDTYCADTVIEQLRPGTKIVTVDGLTEGAACTVLAASHIINDGRELILANSDQFLDYDLSEFLNAARRAEADGAILTFRASDKKWSYAALGEDGYVSRVAEKEPISPFATVGVYYFRQGSSFISAAKQMIAKNIRVNNEFYVCPVFNELIDMGGRVITVDIPSSLMHGLGTPEDLEVFLTSSFAETQLRAPRTHR
jgi:HAD superfamily hydrolase (TIGR01509 family)